MSLDEKWIAEGATTFHGLLCKDFPNLLLTGPTQAGSTANFAFSLEVLAQHAKYILKEAGQKLGTDKFTVEPTKEAEDAYSGEIAKRATKLAAVSTCTPSYINRESERPKDQDMATMLKGLRAGGWAEGIIDYMRVLEEWRNDGKLEGLEITSSA